MDIGGRWHRRVWQAVGLTGGAGVTASVLYAVVQLSRGGLQPQDTAGLLGLPLGTAALLVSVLALRKPPEGNIADLVRTWAATLATQVATGEGCVYSQLLGDDSVPIDLAYTLQPAPGRTATAPPPRPSPAHLEKLDGYRVRGEPGPVVLTCRTAHLQALADRGTLRDSVQVAIAPVTPTNAVNYLTARAQDQTRWQRSQRRFMLSGGIDVRRFTCARILHASPAPAPPADAAPSTPAVRVLQTRCRQDPVHYPVRYGVHHVVHHSVHRVGGPWGVSGGQVGFLGGWLV
ncbi:hypothetical protein [Actinacidiphila glaucinigra]|uniref:hypothetical protein n=1 Tax=Actinacidiphila glaucinigra TaxID=235986 RepID=UPI0035DFBCE6